MGQTGRYPLSRIDSVCHQWGFVVNLCAISGSFQTLWIDSLPSQSIYLTRLGLVIVKCPVCDLEHHDFEIKCRECEVRLDGKKLKTPRSKRSKGKDKYKRKRPPCSGNKQTYKTKREANIAAKAMYNQGRGLRSYRCTDCAGFHLTKLRQGR